MQDNHSRSARGVAARACTSRSAPARPSSCAARAGRSSTSRLTSAAGRRPSGAGTRCGSTTWTSARSTCRSASPTASSCVSEVADVVYRCSSYYDPDARARLRLGRPGRRHRLARRPRRRGLGARRRRPAPAPRSPTSSPSSTRLSPGAGEHGAVAEPQVGVGAGVPASSARAARAAARRPSSSRRAGSSDQRVEHRRQRLGPAGEREDGGRVAHHLEVRRVVAHHQRGARRHALDDHRVGAAHLGRRAHDPAAVHQLAVAVAEDVAGEAHVRPRAALQRRDVVLGVGRVAHHHQRPAGAHRAVRRDQQVGVVLGHEAPHEQDEAPRLHPQAAAPPGVAGVGHLGAVGDPGDPPAGAPLVEVGDGGRVGHGDRWRRTARSAPPSAGTPSRGPTTWPAPSRARRSAAPPGSRPGARAAPPARCRR